MCISFFKFNILFLRKVDLSKKNLVLPEEKFVYPIHTEIFAPKINEINFIAVRDCWLLIGRKVFVTSEKYRPTNHRPRTALCH